MVLGGGGFGKCLDYEDREVLPLYCWKFNMIKPHHIQKRRFQKGWNKAAGVSYNFFSIESCFLHTERADTIGLGNYHL